MAIATRTFGTTPRTGTKFNKINTALWTAQGALAVLFLFSGSSELTMSAEHMAAKMPLEMPLALMRFIGACEVAGALGLILPSISRIRPGLTPLAACGLVIIMTGATTVTVIGGPAIGAIFPLLVGLTAAFVAYGRTHLAPLTR